MPIISKKLDQVKEVETVDIDRVDDLPEPPQKQQPNKLKQMWQKYWSKKKITIPVTVLLLVVVIFLVPYSRYKILGIFIEKSITVSVYDEQNGKPVSEALVEIDGKTAKTDGNGKIKIDSVRVGERQLKITKKYYDDFTTIKLIQVKDQNNFDVRIRANGRQVSVTVKSLISDTPIVGASITAGEVNAITDDNGSVVLVFPPESQKQEVIVKANKHNPKNAQIIVTEEDTDENNIRLTPEGKVYFNSKQSGKLDLVQTNLDGTDRKTIVDGTGKEDDSYTPLLSSRDWRYLALISSRDGKSKLYVVDTQDNSLNVISEENESVVPIGWKDQYFIYSSNNGLEIWYPKRERVVSYDAERHQKITLEESRAEGTGLFDYAAEQFTTFGILKNEIVTTKTWSADSYSGGKILGKKDTINSISPAGTDRKVIKEFDTRVGANNWFAMQKYKPQILNYRYSHFPVDEYYEYSNGKLLDAPGLRGNDFAVPFPTYIISPSGTKTFWQEVRDGKNVLFIGDKDANVDGSKMIASMSEFNAAGWFSEDYILLTKSGNELYISDTDKVDNPTKISDFQPITNFTYLGGGYSYIIR